MAEVRGWNVLHPTPDGQASSHHDTLPFREKLQLEERWPTGWNGCPTGILGFCPFQSWDKSPGALIPSLSLPHCQTQAFQSHKHF